MLKSIYVWSRATLPKSSSFDRSSGGCSKTSSDSFDCERLAGVQDYEAEGGTLTKILPPKVASR
jgi:hypothetical protein